MATRIYSRSEKQSYHLHFGVSDSETYHLTVELSKLANAHWTFQYQVSARNANEFEYRESRIPKDFSRHGWQIVQFTEEQIDFMAYFHYLIRNLPEPDIFGTRLTLLEKYADGYEVGTDYDSEQAKKTFELIELSVKNAGFYKTVSYNAKDYIKQKIVGHWRNNITRVEEKLAKEGYLDYQDPQTGNIVKAFRQPKDYSSLYQKVKNQISQELFADAVSTCYEINDGKNFGGVFRELIYLKFLGRIPLTGKDLIHFRPDSDRTDLINNHLDEYVLCIDTALSQQEENDRPSLLDILSGYVLTIPEMVNRVNRRLLCKPIYLTNSRYSEIIGTQATPFTSDTFGKGFYLDHETKKAYKTLVGKLFTVYPDFVQHCSVIEAPFEKKYFRLWIVYSPKFFQENVIEKGLSLIGIEVYRHKKWGWSSRKPDFTLVTSLQEVDKKDIGTSQIEYTGRSHFIEGKEFYEVNLLRRNPDKSMVLENPFLEMLDEIFREAENILRERHGIPRIGEGWVSEMELFGLVKKFFPDAKHHESPNWLKPQHLDIFVPSQNIAFEYQGKQHYEPVDYFGGEESFLSTKERDLRKKKKCDQNRISLIYWHFEESINEKNLLEKLSRAQIKKLG